jgi:hypothetical protein
VILGPVLDVTREIPGYTSTAHDKRDTPYCTISTKCSRISDFWLAEMADKFSFELRRFLKTSENWGVTRHLNVWSK